jgi:hypothetical protein
MAFGLGLKLRDGARGLLSPLVLGNIIPDDGRSWMGVHKLLIMLALSEIGVTVGAS